MNQDKIEKLVAEKVIKKLQEKKDRCYRKAKATYDVFPSAYASGAIVRCRKGEIWKESPEINKDNKNSMNEDASIVNVALELAGLIPGIGEFADATNVVLYSRKGEYLHAALSAISIIPTIGDAIGKGGKLAVFASKVAPKGGKVEKLGKETVDMIIKVKDLIKNNKALIDKMFDALEKNAEIAKFLPKIKEAINIFLTEDNKLNEKKRKLDKPSSEESLRDWFGRKGEKGSKGGWIDCNTCKKNKETGRKECKACGRSEGEKRSKYPKCRPTPSQCDGFKNKKEK